MYPDIDQLKAILLEQNYVSEADSAMAEKVARGNVAEYIDTLIREEVLTKTLLGQAIAESYKLPFIDINALSLDSESYSVIPEDMARKQSVVYVKIIENTVVLASSAPNTVDQTALQTLFPNKQLQIAYTLPEYIMQALSHYEKTLQTRFSKIIEGGQRVAPEIVDEIIKDALNYRASDIHLEPQATAVSVRFRVDGTLHEAGEIPTEYYENILNRIKVQSGMRIDEHYFAQDGSLRHQSEEYSADLRVSLVPTLNGEKVVMRVLGSYTQGYNLADLGLSDAHRHEFEAAAAKPFGMILTTGPTGSGKTTSLYALLKLLNKPDVNITTIEDPVEYRLAGINQIQVRRASDLTFSSGLRAIVRQDPDVILVGEIRDKETAEISVNAALTGHLLLSTFHANDAATAIPRLIEMGIEPFLLASTLEIIIAQRLARRICTNCQTGVPVEQVIQTLPLYAMTLRHYFKQDDTVYEAKGCEVCNGTGYRGRIGLFEIIRMTPEMKELVLGSPSAPALMALARKQGSVPMFEDGIEKIKTGQTTVAEVLRVVEPPELAV